MDLSGRVLAVSHSSDVNTNFVAFAQAQQAVYSAVQEALQTGGVEGKAVEHFISGLVGPRFGPETFSELCPNAAYRYYNERDVVFARAGVYRPHGVGVVAATGATAWAIRADDGRQSACGGWGSLLGDEGSAYAMGLLGLRATARAYEGRAALPTRLVEGVAQHFNLTYENFHRGLVHLAYQKPLSRAEIGGVAAVVTRLAQEGDPLASRITAKVAADLAALGLHAARSLFTPAETFTVAAAGGLLNAGELILAPLRQGILDEFPQARFLLGSEAPAIALGKMALYDLGK